MFTSLGVKAVYSACVNVTTLFTTAVVVYVSVSFFTVLLSPVSTYCFTRGNAVSGMSKSLVVFTLLELNWLNGIKSSCVGVAAEEPTSM